MANVIYSINGPVIKVRNTKDFSMMEMVYVGDNHLMGEVIAVNDSETTIQVYESTTGLKPNEPVVGTGDLLCATLGPGILRNIYDGIERPLKKIAEVDGAYIGAGSTFSAIDEEKLWDVKILVKVHDEVHEGMIFATCKETELIEHRSMIPLGVNGNSSKNTKYDGII